MPERQSQTRSILNNIGSIVQDNAIPIAVILTVVMIILPIPKFLIDLAMVVNLALSFVIMLTVLYTRTPANFTSFPRLTLLMTMFGLSINVASTKLILLGNGNLATQSEMVKSFSDIVTGDNLVVGFIVFIIIIVVQDVVVTKGAGRVSEVQARFTLDSMNNKMFDIQNAVQAGDITVEEGAKRKEALRKENAFYSSMDGASKFVSGNVKAGIFITIINIVGGLITGMVFGNMDFMNALQTYTKLTIGDGLLSQVPSLMLSFGTGILVTGSSNEDLIGEQIKKEFSLDGSIYIITGSILVIMALVFHNGSAFALIPIGGLLLWLGIDMIRNKNKVESEKIASEKSSSQNSANKSSSKPEEISPLVKLDELSLELGYALIPLVSDKNGAELVERVKSIRKEEALDLGLVIPPIRIVDQIALKPEEYSFKIRGVEVGRGTLKMGYLMCLNPGNVPADSQIVGEKTKDPAYGLDAIWIPNSKRSQAENAGYSVFDLPTIIATHLTEIIKHNAATILNRQQVSAIIEEVKKTNDVVVNEVLEGQNKFTYGEIEAVLKILLSEQVSIQNMVTILETIGDCGRIGIRDPYDLAEMVRQALGAQICSQYKDENNVLHVLNLSQALAQKLIDKKVQIIGGKPTVAFNLTEGRKFINAVSSAIVAVRDKNFIPIILCPDEARNLVKSAIERECPGVVCLSISEVLAAGPDLKVEALGEINEQ